MNITIRVAQPNDQVAVADLINQMGYPVSATEAARRIALYTQPSYLLWVALQDDEVVGYIALHIYDVLHLPAPEGRVISFCVNEKRRGSGIGTKLLLEAEAYFKEQGCYKIVFNSNLKRPDTHQYYLNRGYQFTSKHFAKFLMS